MWNIEKNSKVYTVTEKEKTWSVKSTAAQVTIEFSVDKALCADAAALERYVREHDDLF